MEDYVTKTKSVSEHRTVAEWTVAVTSAGWSYGDALEALEDYEADMQATWTGDMLPIWWPGAKKFLDKWWDFMSTCDVVDLVEVYLDAL